MDKELQLFFLRVCNFSFFIEVWLLYSVSGI